MNVLLSSVVITDDTASVLCFICFTLCCVMLET